MSTIAVTTVTTANGTTNLITQTGNSAGPSITMAAATPSITFNSNSSTTAITIDSGANVGIGVSSPSAKLSVNGAFSSTSNTATFGTAAYHVANGNFGIGTSSPSYKLSVSGASQSAIAQIASSDASMSRIWLTNTNRAWSISNYGTSYSQNGSYNLADETAAAVRYSCSNTGVHDFYGGGGGAQVRLRGGGDLVIYNADESRAAYIWCDSPVSGMAAAEYVHFERWNSYAQRCGYDRNWDNYPSITVRNDTTNGPQGEFRVHGGDGISGGDFSAALRADGGFITGSDARRKTNIESIQNALGIINQLDGKKFNIINSSGELDPMRGDKKQFGLIAQECANVVPEIVTFYEEANTPNEHGWASAYSIEYDKLTALLVNAVKELSAKNDQLEARIAALESK
jgi:hypothetical protein